MNICLAPYFEARVREAWIAMGGPTVTLSAVADALQTTEAEIRKALSYIEVVDFEGLAWMGVHRVNHGWSSSAAGFPFEDASAARLKLWMRDIMGRESPDYCGICALHLLSCSCFVQPIKGRGKRYDGLKK